MLQVEAADRTGLQARGRGERYRLEVAVEAGGRG